MTKTMFPQFTAVILAGGSGGRLYPLTVESDAALAHSLAKPLLPVANHPLLWYQLRLLEKAGFGHALIITVRRFEERITHFIDAFARERAAAAAATRAPPPHRFEPELFILEDHCGTAEALRRAREQIKTDFVVISGDLITESVLHQLADIHRIRDATLTMLLKSDATAENATDDADKKDVLVKKMRQKKEGNVVEFVGLVEGESRVVLVKEGALDVEDTLHLPKSPLLRRRPSISVHTDLVDAHLYFFGHWILELLQEKRQFSSIKADLVPYLVRHQFRAHSAASSPAAGGAEGDRRLHSRAMSGGTLTGDGADAKTLSLAASLSAVRASKGNAWPRPGTFPGTVDDDGRVPCGASDGKLLGVGQDHGALRCFSVVLPSGELPDGTRGYCCRANTIAAYLGANLDLIATSNASIYFAATDGAEGAMCMNQSAKAQQAPSSTRQYRDCAVADGCGIDATVSLKRSVVGPRCRIGARAKLQNCVLMDNVTVGECCVIQNSILCSNAKVEDRCNLNECQVGVDVTVFSGSKHKSETLVKAPTYI